MEITNVEIEGLFGSETYKISIQDNKLILIAENGSGKTSIVNILYYYLSNQWHKLVRFNFKKISVTISGKDYSLDRDSILDFGQISKRLMRQFSPNLRVRLEPLIRSGELFEIRSNPALLESIAVKYDLSERTLLRIIEDIEPNLFTQFAKAGPVDSFENVLEDTQILFLPTYRRIEQELNLIVRDEENDPDLRIRSKWKQSSLQKDFSYIELVEFGMADVEALFRTKLDQLETNLSVQLKNNLSGKFLRDIINNQYKEISFNEISNFNEDAVENILERMDDSVLTKTEKDQIRKFLSELKSGFNPKDNDDSIKAYFIYRLLTIYNDLKREEEDINSLLSVLHTYIKNKYFYYNTNKFSVTVHPVVKGEPQLDRNIRLMDLSSGEKQIVSLFSHIYLSKKRKYFLIIDEPELSLSVPWQKKFLVDIANGSYCSGIIAVTHSPFIIQNELEKYAHSLNEFNVTDR